VLPQCLYSASVTRVCRARIFRWTVTVASHQLLNEGDGDGADRLYRESLARPGRAGVGARPVACTRSTASRSDASDAVPDSRQPFRTTIRRHTQG